MIFSLTLVSNILSTLVRTKKFFFFPVPTRRSKCLYKLFLFLKNVDIIE